MVLDVFFVGGFLPRFKSSPGFIGIRRVLPGFHTLLNRVAAIFEESSAVANFLALQFQLLELNLVHLDDLVDGFYSEDVDDRGPLSIWIAARIGEP